MNGHDHPHSHADGHEHWDYMAGPVDHDLITDLLRTQKKALTNGVQHLTAQLDDIKAQLARVDEMLALRWQEMATIRAAEGGDSDGDAL